MRSCLVAALALLGLGTAVGPAAAAALEGDQEIAALNGQRAMNGIPGDVVEDIGWSIGCAKHMAYLKLNNTFAHEETMGAPGYTDEGAAAGIRSVLTGSGSSFHADGTNAFQHAPVHFMQMLSPFLVRSGAADGCLVTQFDTSRTFPAPTTFSYPGDGGVALTRETAYEVPFVPGDFVGLPMGTETGPHLYFYAAKTGAYSDYWSRGKITAATLTRRDVGPVTVKWVDNTTKESDERNLGAFLSAGGIVIPVAPLTNGAIYDATVNFTFSSGGTTSRAWSFTASNTLPLPTVPPPSRPPLTPPATPTPAPAPTPTPVPVDTSPVTVTEVKLTNHTLAFKTSRDAPLWITIERQNVTRKGKKRKTTYKVRESLSVEGKASAVVTVTHKKLAKGVYRLTFRRGGAKGVVQLTTSSKIK